MMLGRGRCWVLGVLALLAVACGDDGDAGVDDAGVVDAASSDAAFSDAAPPDAALSDAALRDGGEEGDSGPEDSGIDAGASRRCRGLEDLYVDEACDILAPGILVYTPRFRLWSDGSAKERYTWLPEGSRIDTRDPDNWVYPVGTRIWKNFVVDGIRVETRLLEKRIAGTGAAAWSLRTFGWNAEQTQATELTGGAENVLGTEHDIPGIAACVLCHADRGPTDVILGFTAVQLNHGGSETSLGDLNEAGWLEPMVDLREADVPGEPDAQEALGYLHANCGHCHGGIAPQVGLRLWVDVADETLEQTSAWRTAVGVGSAWRLDGATERIARGNAAGSTVVRRMQSRDEAAQMPPLATERVHSEGIEVLSRWIDSLPSE